MIPLHERQAKFMRHPLERKLGNLAVNFNRIATYSQQDQARDEVLFFVRESKYLADWTALEAELNLQEQLLEMQRVLAKWSNHWQSIWNDQSQKTQLQTQARAWSERLLVIAGLQ
jgi:hypothetical protein